MITFYNVRKKLKVQVTADKVEKVEYKATSKTGKTVIRYAFKSVDEDGTKLTKFVSRSDYDSL
jgi:Zn/Cd-binding protein ZinT